MADFATRSLGVGYIGGSLILFASLMAVLGWWYWSERSISVETVSTPRVEAFYWAAITLSQTLGTALGDWIADPGGLGYEGGALVFAAVWRLPLRSIIGPRSRGSLVLGRLHPDPAARGHLGDFLDKPLDQGGLALSRPIASLVIAAIMVGLILLIPQRAGSHPKAVADSV